MTSCIMIHFWHITLPHFFRGCHQIQVWTIPDHGRPQGRGRAREGPCPPTPWPTQKSLFWGFSEKNNFLCFFPGLLYPQQHQRIGQIRIQNDITDHNFLAPHLYSHILLSLTFVQNTFFPFKIFVVKYQCLFFSLWTEICHLISWKGNRWVEIKKMYFLKSLLFKLF